VVKKTQLDAPPSAPFVYTGKEWSAIAAAFPEPLTADVDVDAARRELEEAATLYLVLSDGYAKRQSRLKPWLTTEKLIKAALVYATDFRHSEVLPHLLEALRCAEPFAFSYKISALSHKNNRATERAQLYECANATWRALGGDPSVSRSDDGSGRKKPTGPAVRYLEAVLTPIMKDNAPGGERMVQIIYGETGTNKLQRMSLDRWPMSDDERARKTALMAESRAREAARKAAADVADVADPDADDAYVEGRGRPSCKRGREK
jgi:hypothetical protein